MARKRRRQRRNWQCRFCANPDLDINYKDVGTLRRFITAHGKIRSRRHTGTCAIHQRDLARAIKRARHMALLPFTGESLR